MQSAASVLDAELCSATGAVLASPASMKEILLTSVCSVLLGFGSMAYGQRSPSQNNPPPASERGAQSQADDSQPVTLTGCLTKGSDQGQYMLTDKGSGEKVQFSASDKIEPFVNQTVQLTGKMADQGGEKAFQPQSVKRVATSCEEK